jgi:hypothetical protein
VERGYLSVPYRNLAHPRITLAEQRAALRKLAQAKHLSLSEDNIFQTVANQCLLVEQARKKPHGQGGKRRHLRPSRTNRTRPNAQNLESLEPTIRLQVRCSLALLRSGMSDRTHLCLEALEESCLPDEERIRRIRAERWISYARAEEVLESFPIRE